MMSLDPLVVSSIGTTITRRDSEDGRLLEVEVLTHHDFQSPFHNVHVHCE